MRSLLTLLLTLTLAVPAFAAFSGPGTTPTVTSAAQVADAPDDASCVLEGNIVEKITGKSDKYIFKDTSGQVVVDIDLKVFAGRDVTPAMRVRLEGEVDKEMMRPNEVDVKILTILQ